MKVVWDQSDDELWRIRRAGKDPEIVTAAELRRLMSLKRKPRLTLRERARIHTCTVCEKSGPWTDGWGWYGSYKDLDDDKAVVKCCSEACKDIAKQNRLIPLHADEQ